jgi:hypothetical protein
MHSLSPSHWLDRLAIGASAACLIHCLFLPIVVAVLPATSRILDVPEEAHIYVFLGAVPISALAMIRGYQLHGLPLPASLGILGLALLAVGALAQLEGVLEVGFTLAGSTFLAVAHIRNWQARSRSPGEKAGRCDRAPGV